MDNQKPRRPNSLYPDIHSEEQLYHSHHNHPPSASVSLYPTVYMEDIVENPPGRSNAEGKGYPLYGENKVPEASNYSPCAPMEATEEVLIRIPGVVVHLIDKEESVELGCGDFMLVKLVQGGNDIAVFARVEDQIQWPLAKDEATVKLDDCHYFFSLRVPKEAHDSDEDDDDQHPNSNSKPSSSSTETDALNYGVTFVAEDQDFALKELDEYLERYSCFSVHGVSESVGGSGVLGDTVVKETTAEEMAGDEEKKKLVKERSAAYWTTLAPNVEDYSFCVARAIAAGSGHIIKGILWCGDVTVDQLRWGNEFLKKRLQPSGKPTEISPKAMRRMRRAKRVTKMSHKVARGVLSGVVKVAGFTTKSVVSSKPGKKFFSLLPGEIVLASLDAFGKVFDAVEVVGKNVLTTSSVVTTGLVSHRYGEQAAEFTNEGLGAAGHVISTGWTILKIRNALNPKKALKPSTLAKSAVKTASKAVTKEEPSK